MKVEKIDHIHLYVNDLEKAARALRAVLGSDFVTFGNGTIFLDLTAEHGVRLAYHRLGIELLQVTNPKLRTAQLPKGRQEGVFAISLKIPDTDEAIAELKSRGLKMISKVQVGQVKETLFESPNVPGVQIELSDYPGTDIVGSAGT